VHCPPVRQRVATLHAAYKTSRGMCIHGNALIASMASMQRISLRCLALALPCGDHVLCVKSMMSRLPHCDASRHGHAFCHTLAAAAASCRARMAPHGHGHRQHKICAAEQPEFYLIFHVGLRSAWLVCYVLLCLLLGLFCRPQSRRAGPLRWSTNGRTV
jgi:hypothetical protein